MNRRFFLKSVGAVAAGTLVTGSVAETVIANPVPESSKPEDMKKVNQIHLLLLHS